MSRKRRFEATCRRCDRVFDDSLIFAEHVMVHYPDSFRITTNIKPDDDTTPVRNPHPPIASSTPFPITISPIFADVTPTSSGDFRNAQLWKEIASKQTLRVEERASDDGFSEITDPFRARTPAAATSTNVVKETGFFSNSQPHRDSEVVETARAGDSSISMINLNTTHGTRLTNWVAEAASQLDMDSRAAMNGPSNLVPPIIIQPHPTLNVHMSSCSEDEPVSRNQPSSHHNNHSNPNDRIGCKDVGQSRSNKYLPRNHEAHSSTNDQMVTNYETPVRSTKLHLRTRDVSRRNEPVANLFNKPLRPRKSGSMARSERLQEDAANDATEARMESDTRQVPPPVKKSGPLPQPLKKSLSKPPNTKNIVHEAPTTTEGQSSRPEVPQTVVPAPHVSVTKKPPPQPSQKTNPSVPDGKLAKKSTSSQHHTKKTVVQEVPSTSITTKTSTSAFPPTTKSRASQQVTKKTVVVAVPMTNKTAPKKTLPPKKIVRREPSPLFPEVEAPLEIGSTQLLPKKTRVPAVPEETRRTAATRRVSVSRESGISTSSTQVPLAKRPGQPTVPSSSTQVVRNTQKTVPVPPLPKTNKLPPGFINKTSGGIVPLSRFFGKDSRPSHVSSTNPTVDVPPPVSVVSAANFIGPNTQAPSDTIVTTNSPSVDNQSVPCPPATQRPPRSHPSPEPADDEEAEEKCCNDNSLNVPVKRDVTRSTNNTLQTSRTDYSVLDVYDPDVHLCSQQPRKQFNSSLWIVIEKFEIIEDYTPRQLLVHWGQKFQIYFTNSAIVDCYRSEDVLVVKFKPYIKQFILEKMEQGKAPMIYLIKDQAYFFSVYELVASEMVSHDMLNFLRTSIVLHTKSLSNPVTAEELSFEKMQVKYKDELYTCEAICQKTGVNYSNTMTAVHNKKHRQLLGE